MNQDEADPPVLAKRKESGLEYQFGHLVAIKEVQAKVKSLVENDSSILRLKRAQHHLPTIVLDNK